MTGISVSFCCHWWCWWKNQYQVYKDIPFSPPPPTKTPMTDTSVLPRWGPSPLPQFQLRALICGPKRRLALHINSLELGVVSLTCMFLPYIHSKCPRHNRPYHNDVLCKQIGRSQIYSSVQRSYHFVELEHTISNDNFSPSVYQSDRIFCQTTWANSFHRTMNDQSRIQSSDQYSSNGDFQTWACLLPKRMWNAKTGLESEILSGCIP